MQIGIAAWGVVVWVLSGVICGVIAGGKARNKEGWFLAGLLFGPIGIVLALVVQPNQAQLEHSRVATGSMKRCTSLRRAHPEGSEEVSLLRNRGERVRTEEARAYSYRYRMGRLGRLPVIDAWCTIR